MFHNVWIFVSGIFVLAAACYLLFLTSEPLERVGARLGRLLKLPNDVIASTFQALATSGPEIVMAILAATPFVAQGVWSGLQTGEKACSGTLNMSFSAMDNLLGIGAVGMIYMMRKGTLKGDDPIRVNPSVQIGLLFYTVSSTCLAIFITDGVITELEAWVLMAIGILFILSQFVLPGWLERRTQARVAAGLQEPLDEDEGGDDEDERPLPETTGKWLREFGTNTFLYCALVFGLVVFVRECLDATFTMATVGVVSIGGILLLFTSYVSSFPEFMMTYQYAKANKRHAMLGMLFGSNVIDLAFAGFRSLWLHEPTPVYTTGLYPQLLTGYIWALPVLSVFLLVGMTTGALKFKHAYPLLGFYFMYIISGFVLL